MKRLETTRDMPPFPSILYMHTCKAVPYNVNGSCGMSWTSCLSLFWEQGFPTVVIRLINTVRLFTERTTTPVAGLAQLDHTLLMSHDKKAKEHCYIAQGRIILLLSGITPIFAPLLDKNLLHAWTCMLLHTGTLSAVCMYTVSLSWCSAPSHKAVRMCHGQPRQALTATTKANSMRGKCECLHK